MASGGRRVVGRRNLWEPSRPNGVPSDHPFKAEPALAVVGGTGEWVYAPSTSHISRFKFDDARTNRLLKNFGFGATSSGGVRRHEGASELRVVFRDADSGAESVEYVYWFHDHAAGAAVAEAMTGHPHPYGEVLYPEVIAPNRVPYQRASQ